MARVAPWILGLLTAPAWATVLLLIGAWLGSTMDDFEIGFLLGLMILGPIPLVVALALRRENLRAHPVRAAFSAGLAAGGYLSLLVIAAALAAPYFLFPSPVFWILVALLFVIPVFVWPLMFRKPAAPDDGKPPPKRDREVIRFP